MSDVRQIKDLEELGATIDMTSRMAVFAFAFAVPVEFHSGIFEAIEEQVMGQEGATERSMGIVHGIRRAVKLAVDLKNESEEGE